MVMGRNDPEPWGLTKSMLKLGQKISDSTLIFFENKMLSRLAFKYQLKHFGHSNMFR